MSEAKSSRKCTECGTAHTAQRGDCLPLAQRQGPSVTDPGHPSNSGAWARVVAVPPVTREVIHGASPRS